MERVNVNQTKLFPHALYYLVRLSRDTHLHWCNAELCENSRVMSDVQMCTETSVNVAHVLIIKECLTLAECDNI